MWEANLQKDNLDNLGIMESLWLDVLKCWNRLTLKNPTTGPQVWQQSLWMNLSIQIEGKPVKWKHWIKKGILVIEDIMPEGRLLSISQLNRKFDNQLCCMELWGLYEAILQEWKRFLKENNGQEDNNWYEAYTSNKSVIRRACCDLNAESFIDLIWEKWQKQNIELNNFEIESTLQNDNKITIYRSFQYCFLHKGLITNIHHKRYKIKFNDLCSFCQIVQNNYSLLS